nr:receptor-like serine/threonine-protein kinase SD1-8 [Ipomoea batatas]
MVFFQEPAHVQAGGRIRRSRPLQEHRRLRARRPLRLNLQLQRDVDSGEQLPSVGDVCAVGGDDHQVPGPPDVCTVGEDDVIYGSGAWNGIRFSSVPEMNPTTVIAFSFVYRAELGMDFLLPTYDRQ